MMVFAFLAIFTLAGVQAADGNAARVVETGTEYAAFEEAISAAETGQTVELLQNAEFSGGMTIDKNLTIDGKGFALTDTGTESTFSVKITSGTVTVKNITIKRDKQKIGFFHLPQDGATLVLSDNVTMDGLKGGDAAAVLLEGGMGCKLNITGENVKMINCTGYFGAIGATNYSVVTINNVEITLTDKSGTARNGIGVFNNAKLTMYAGKISGYQKAGIGLGNENWHKKVGANCVVNIGSDVIIEDCVTGIYMAGTPKISMAGTITGGNTGINATNDSEFEFAGTLEFSGTITNCKKGINAAGGTVNITGGLISECHDVNASNVKTGAGIYVSGATVTVSGGSVTGSDNGIQLADNSAATVTGTANITGNTTNTWIPGTSTLYISGTLSGKVGIKTGLDTDERMANNVKATDDFTGLANLGCITNDWNGSRFGYYNGATFGWTKHPEPTASTDSGIYRTEEGGENLGVIRFITEFSAENAEAIEYVGLYALNADTVKATEIPDGTKFERFDNGFAAGKNAYAVDVISISRINFEKPVTGVVFVKIKGVETPVYLVVSGAKVNTDKYLGINAESDFAAQEVTE